MANRRMLHKNISYSEQVEELSSDFVKLLFTWMIPHLDDFGRINGKASTIRAMVIPMQTDKTVSDVESALQEMDEKGLLDRYEVEDELIIELPTFDKYQSGLTKRTKSAFPDNPENQRTSVKFRVIQRTSLSTEHNKTEQEGTQRKVTEGNDVEEIPY
ncbi:MAG: hypothetical protein ACR2LN_03530 [Candidatus Levyibacteriota bacterium]